MWKKIEFKGKNKKKENSLKNEYEKESILEKGHKKIYMDVQLVRQLLVYYY